MEQNTAAIQEPVTIAGGDVGATSFDDLEALSSAKMTKDRRTDGEKFVPPTEDTPKKKEAKDAKSKEGKDKEDDSAEKEEVKKESGKDSKDAESKPDKTKPGLEKSEQVVKTLKLKHGETEVDVSADALVPVKVNGKTEQVKLQEVLNGYSGQSALDRQFASFKKERDTFAEQQKLADEAVKELYERAVVKKDLRGFVEYLAGAYGQDPIKLYNELIGSVEQNLEQLVSLSPEEREAKRAKEELEYFRKRDEQARQSLSQTKALEARKEQLGQLLQKNSISIDAFEKAYKEIREIGSMKEEDITPEVVVEYHKNITAIDTVSAALDKYAPDLENKDAELEKLSTYAIQTGANSEEIEEVVKTLYEHQAEKKLTKKIEKQERKSRAETPVQDPQKYPTFFDELV